ncbi:MAG: hypothetical protein J0I84_25430 [Terrimonas sp.]|uniref:hypothetical protein n=1 Tax=Terrimonas sp. TaxID=1914338 RepID=UPI000926BA76|nr:hypothetical protein [Terrimonas sp.]MBN8790436.1 hypothetical protein [Terrimonas sp.]OJZ00311.1 MAG: hypothetical protein BGP13_20450 [Sphingobacteriales bacterium 40-81]PVD49768.1 hypothetical protein DC498_23250 [Terrimonas sp.]
MKKIIAIFLLLLFTFQSFSYEVISFVFSKGYVLEEKCCNTSCNEDAVNKAVKADSITEPSNYRFQFQGLANEDMALRVIAQEPLLSHLYFEITVPPPNCFA